MDPFKRLREIASDDVVVKVMFDHVRNLGICALMMGAGQFALEQPERFAPAWLAVTCGAVIVFAAGVLTTVNAMHGLRKALAIERPIERYGMYLVVNLIGPVTIGAVLVGRPFGG